MKRTIKDYLLISLKGIAMGAADVVPGISGGTIAFIVGVYEELINSIKSINISSLKLFFTGKITAFWKAINANFLAALVAGITFSVFSLAKAITYLLTTYPILVWAFFFGLMLASVWIIAKEVEKWNWKTITCFVIGAIIAFLITMATPAETPNGLWFIFLCGMIAICAMILPGTSGSFMLILLGKYEYIMESVKNLDFSVIIVFIMGAIVGITSFSRILSYALRNFYTIMIAILSGFMLGSLNKIWPWKEIVETQTIIKEINIWPNELILESIGLAAVGFALVYFLEKLSNKKTKEKI